VSSYELGPAEAAVLVPVIAVILFMAVYPQLALHRSESSVKASVAAAATGRGPALAGPSQPVLYREPKSYGGRAKAEYMP
jgi:uncharacterized membrane protein YjfL (UPF0719 family)